MAPSAGISYVPERLRAAVPILSTDGFSTPVFLTRSYFVSKLTVTGSVAGVPPATSSAFESLVVPLVDAEPLADEMFPSRSRMPPPGKSDVTVTGNFEEIETFDAVTFTLL